MPTVLPERLQSRTASPSISRTGSPMGSPSMSRRNTGDTQTNLDAPGATGSAAPALHATPSECPPATAPFRKWMSRGDSAKDRTFGIDKTGLGRSTGSLPADGSKDLAGSGFRRQARSSSFDRRNRGGTHVKGKSRLSAELKPGSVTIPGAGLSPGVGSLPGGGSLAGGGSPPRLPLATATERALLAKAVPEPAWLSGSPAAAARLAAKKSASAAAAHSLPEKLGNLTVGNVAGAGGEKQPGGPISGLPSERRAEADHAEASSGAPTPRKISIFFVSSQTQNSHI